MAGAMDLRGRAVISDGATGPLRSIKGQLDAIGHSASRVTVAANAIQTLGRSAQRLGAGLMGAGAVGGYALKSLIDQTRTFNEAKFGYGFARMTSFMKDGKLDMQAWRADMDKTARSARDASVAFGALPETTMRAREEVEKLGFKGAESEGIFSAALGLHLSDPQDLASGEAAKYVGAMYRAFAKSRDELASKMGVAPDNEEFVKKYAKGLAGKAAIAAAESALGPADLIEGMRQYAPQWAAMGIDYDFALAALAHGSNYGFRAPELGTAFKSMVTKTINPTAQGLAVLDKLHVNRSDFMTAAPVLPAQAANRLNSLLNGQLFAGKGKAGRKSQIIEMLDTAYRQGLTADPEFQQTLTEEVMRMLGKGYAGRIDDVRESVANATITGQGGLKMPEFIKELRDKGATVGDIATIFEGRHVARYTPLFQFYEQLIGMYEKLKGTDGAVMDEVVDARKSSEAGKTDRVSASWQNLMLKLEESGGIVDMAKSAIIGFNQALAGLPTEALTAVTGAIGALGALAAGGMAVGTFRMLRDVLVAAGGAGAPSVAGPVAGAATGIAGTATTAGVGVPLGGGVVVGLPFGYAAYQAMKEHDKHGGSWWDSLYRGLSGNGAGDADRRRGYQDSIGSAVSPPAAATSDAGAAASEAQQMESTVQQTVERMRAAVAAVDLSGEGQRIGQSLVSGLQAGLAGAEAAIAAAGARMQAAARKIQLNTGPAMGTAGAN